MTREQITIMIAETYEKVMGYYQRLIDLLAKQIEFKNADEIP
jgi:cupin superfamily acireductone dioxygenase involved in methionine salvage